MENNFTKDEDYKLILLPREKKQNVGRCEEEIMLNTDTFKNLCMIAKTQKGKENLSLIYDSYLILCLNRNVKNVDKRK